MFTRDSKQLACESKENGQVVKLAAKHKVSPLRKCMIRDMYYFGTDKREALHG